MYPSIPGLMDLVRHPPLVPLPDQFLPDSQLGTELWIGQLSYIMPD
jgi:hypothetical protein